MQRRGLTLIEMVVALLSSGVLVAGLAGALYVSTQAMPTIESNTKKDNLASSVLHDLIADVGTALSFSERTTKAITFTVPDRNGDSLVETIRYAWSGTAGDPLTYQYNGGTVYTLAEDVQVFNLAALTRELLAESSTTIVPTGVVLEETSVTKASTNVTSLNVTKPPGTVGGNLLIACISLDGNALSSLSAPSGWTLIHKGPQDVGSIAQTFGVWYKIATDSEPSTFSFTWSPTEEAYAWVMRFSGHDPTNPINAAASSSDVSITNLTTPSPSVTTSVANAMILRIQAADGIVLPLQTTSLLLHTYIVNERSSNKLSSACSGTAAYILQPAIGSSGMSTGFIRTGTKSPAYTSVTIAIAPVPAQ